MHIVLTARDCRDHVLAIVQVDEEMPAGRALELARHASDEAVAVTVPGLRRRLEDKLQEHGLKVEPFTALEVFS